MQIITLTTDFGYDDWFVGTMKGVILSLAPDAKIVDLNHGIQPQNVRAGAFSLMASCRYFPRHTIHICVVDPGVGSDRLPLAIASEEHLFIGPDNGVLSWALEGRRIDAAHRIENPEFMLDPVGRTFDARDLFAPAAGQLAAGQSIMDAGPSVDSFIRIRFPETQTGYDKKIHGEVLYIDHYGNAVTNLPNRHATAGSSMVHVADGQLSPVHHTYQSVPLHAPVTVTGSSGFLEISVNEASAESRYGLHEGSMVTLIP